MDQQEEIQRLTKAELAALIVTREAEVMTKAELVPISVRVPSWIMAKLDAMTTHSGKSRNHVFNLVLDAGVESVWSHLPNELRTELEFEGGEGVRHHRPGNVGEARPAGLCGAPEARRGA